MRETECATRLLEPGKDYRSSATDDYHADIVEHYDECYWEYRTAWLNSENLAIHYGYWDENTRSHSDSLLNMNRALAKKAGIKAGDKILDAGCGLGGSSIWLAENFNVTVTGITLSPSQVEHATRFAEKRGVADRVKFKVADYCKTPFEEESFDIVWGLESVCYALHKKLFTDEAYRVLKKGGRLVSADGFSLKESFNEEEWVRVVTCLDGWAVPNLATPEGFKQYLQESGFSKVDYSDITANTMPSAKRMYYTALVTWPMQRLLVLLKLKTKAQDRNFYTALRQYQVFKDGLACYGLFCAEK